MKRVSLAFVLFFAVAVGAALLLAPRNASAGPSDGGPKVVGVFGVAEVNGQQVVVHILAVVPPGRSEASVRAEVLHDHNAREIGSANFTTDGLVWDAFIAAGKHGLVQNYNPKNDPTGVGKSKLQSTEDTWSLAGASFAFGTMGQDTTRCPSLVRECGRQVFDGKNDVGWLALRGCCTLAVTWYGTTIDEADMALNTKFAWSVSSCTTSSSSPYDAESVILHENGHVVGLGHSQYSTAVMYAYYHGCLRSLTQDDKDGIKFLYP